MPDVSFTFFPRSKNVEGILDIRRTYVVTVAGAVWIRWFVAWFVESYAPVGGALVSLVLFM